MTDLTLLSALCQKLGHGLEEVRVRALESILLKLDRGFIHISDLARTKDFLVKLLEWFGLHPCSDQERVLSLILRILKEEGSERLIAQIGVQRTLLALNTIRDNLPSDLCSLLDDIAGLVHRAQVVQGQSENESGSNQNSAKISPTEQSSYGRQSEGSPGACLLDASLAEALQENEVSQESTDRVLHTQGQCQMERTIASHVLKHILLPWQPLVSTDRHVLIAVESSLTNRVDRPQLLNTCSFVTDVMMRDFPAEVFLQRPAILMIFLRLMNSSLLSGDKQLARSIISCLLTLTNALLCRLRFYQDPNMANQKLENFLQHEDDATSQTSAESLLTNLENHGDGEGLSRIPEWNDYAGKLSNSQTSSASSTQSVPPTSAERSHCSETQMPTDSAASEESSVLRLQQCSLPQYSLLAMRHVLPHVDDQPESTILLFKLTRLLINCVTPQIWLAPASDRLATDIATNFYEVLEMLGELLQQDRSQTESRLVHLHLLVISRHLLQCLVPIEVADRCLPRKMKTALCNTLLDGALHAFFPLLHSDLRQYTQMLRNVRDVDNMKIFESTLSVAESLSSAAKLLTQEDVKDGSKMVLNMECALASLSFHQDFRFISLVFDNCSKNYHRWHLTDNENHTLTCVLLKFLAHADLNVQRKAYSHLHQLVLDNLSVQASHQSPAESLAFLLFNTPILLEITCHGISSSDELVQSCAEDIILHTLKAKFLLGSTQWSQFLASLVPVLPLLQCWSDKPSALGRAIITMLNPDVGCQMSLETGELLKGNLRLLFSKDEFVRGEALSRLVWLLTKEEGALDKVPHIATLHNCATDRICLIEKPVEVLQNIPEQSFYQESSLIQLLEIIESTGLEPRMLLSSLTQLAAILEDPRHHEVFLSRAGLSLSVGYLHAAVCNKRFEVYPEVVVPSISILKSLSIHHSPTRHQLSKCINIFYSTVRGLIMFPSDLRLHVNASQLLAVLLYNDVIISAAPRTLSDGYVVRGISVPHLIDSQMKFPIICTTHWKTSHFTEPLMTDVLLRNEECRAFLATAWNLSYFTNEQSPLLWKVGTKLPKAISDAQKNFSSSLLLSTKYLQILQASAMLNLCQKQLLIIQEASTHIGVLKSLEIMKSILFLYKMINENRQAQSSDTMHFHQLYRNLSWRQTFRRFLMAAPASVEDQHLLVQILHFLKMHVSASRSLDIHLKDTRWLLKLLQHPSQPLPNLFHTVAHTGYAGDNEMPQELSHLPKWKELCKELLGLVMECDDFEEHFSQDPTSKTQREVFPMSGDNKENIEKEQKSKESKTQTKSCTSSKKSSGSELDRAGEWVGEVVSCAADEAQSTLKSNWTSLVQNIVSCLKSSDTQHFYNLAYLDWLLWTLTHLTSKQGWSSTLQGAQLKVLFLELLKVLLELVQAFHFECGKGGSSFMGLSITRASIISLNHLLEEMQQYKEIKWEDIWQTASRKTSRAAVYVPWLPSLFRSREPTVRAAALQLASKIGTSTSGYDFITCLQTDHPDIWMTPLCILLDRDEASVVREQAANLLTNLVRTRFSSSVCKKDGSENSSLEIFHHRLTESGFIEEIWSILDCLYLATSWEPRQSLYGNVGVGLMHWTVPGTESKNAVPTDQLILINCNGGPRHDVKSVPCTPSLISSICKFLVAIMDMDSDILFTFAKEGIASQLLRCVDSIPPLDPQNRRAYHLYCDMLAMYASVCHLVCRLISCDAVSCQYTHQQPHTYHKLLLLLDPSLFCVELPALLRQRNDLWTEVLWLISMLLTISADDKTCEENGHSVFHSLLIRSQGEPLVSVLNVALSGSMLTNLQRAALACVQSLLSHPASSIGQPFAILLDDVDADFNSSLVAVKETNLELSIGASLCRSLLGLYDVHSIQMGSADKFYREGLDWQAQRFAVAGALSAVLEASVAAKEVALNHGLVELLCAQMGAIQTHLILDPGETMKRLATKKKVCPMLQDLDLLLGLLNSATLRNVNAKQLASDVGVTDTLHKLWAWCLAHHSLLLNVLRFLATLTSGCPPAAHSLVLTTAVPGLGLRRTPSSQSLLQALASLMLHETELALGNHDLTVLTIVSTVLCNACHVSECRIALTKGNLLRGLHCLHNCLSKKSKKRRDVENIWLGLLVHLSAFQEGQVVLPKVPDFFEYLLNTAEGQSKNKKLALQILRNLAFNPINRPRLLGSGEFLLLINRKLQDGDTDEQVAAAASLWALIANNQKGKLTAKCAGADAHILDSLRKLAVCHRSGADFVAQLLNCVLRVLRHEPSASAP